MKTHNMIMVGLVLILAMLSTACDPPDGGDIQVTINTIEKTVPATITQWGNTTADTINKAAEDVGIPNSVPGVISAEITDWSEKVHDKDFFK